MELDLRGTDAGTIAGYLVRLGGREEAPGSVAGDGWNAVLAAGIHRYRNWEFPRVVVTLTGDPDRVEEIASRLRLMAWRGGG